MSQCRLFDEEVKEQKLNEDNARTSPPERGRRKRGVGETVPRALAAEVYRNATSDANVRKGTRRGRVSDATTSGWLCVSVSRLVLQGVRCEKNSATGGYEEVDLETNPKVPAPTGRRWWVTQVRRYLAPIDWPLDGRGPRPSIHGQSSMLAAIHRPRRTGENSCMPSGRHIGLADGQLQGPVDEALRAP